jgi:hypothetical protein
MAKRAKIYYPAFQITTGLYTAGKEWMYRTTKEEYSGGYHKYVDGTVMTLGSYDKSLSEHLIPYVEQSKNPEKNIYDTIRKGEDVTKYIAPQAYNPRSSLKPDDYKLQWFNRYFVKRRNYSNGTILEIDEKQFSTLQKTGAGINGALYSGLSIRWKIAGDIETVTDGPVTIYGIPETNKRTLFFNESKMPGITNYLPDLQEFSIYNKLTDEAVREELL